MQYFTSALCLMWLLTWPTLTLQKDDTDEVTIQPSSDRAISFSLTGLTSNRVEYANIINTLDIGGTIREAGKLIKALNLAQMREKYRPHHQQWLERDMQTLEVKGLKHRAETTLKAFEGLTKTPKHHSRHLQKRIVPLIPLAIGLFGLISGFVGTAFGLYNQKELEKISNKVNRVKSDLSLVAKGSRKALEALTMHNADIHTLAFLVKQTARTARTEYRGLQSIAWDDAAISVLKDRVALLEDSLTQAFSKRISIKAMANWNLDAISDELFAQADSKGMIPVATHHSDWLQYQTSFTFQNGTITTITHIPLIPRHGEMTIWRHLPLPIPLNNGLYAIPRLQKNYIAISDDESVFKTLSETDLRLCQALGTFYTCDRQNVVRKAPRSDSRAKYPKDEDLCLFALFSGRYDLAEQTCWLDLVAATPQVFQSAPAEFHTFNPDSHRGRITCRDHSKVPNQAFDAHEAFRLTELPSGCQAETQTHIFWPADVFFTRNISANTVQHTWPKSLATLRLKVTRSDFDKIADKAGAVMKGTDTKAALIQDGLTSLPPADWVEQVNYYITGIGFLLATISATAALFITWLLKQYQQRLRDQEHRISALVDTVQELTRQSAHRIPPPMYSIQPVHSHGMAHIQDQPAQGPAITQGSLGISTGPTLPAINYVT